MRRGYVVVVAVGIADYRSVFFGAKARQVALAPGEVFSEIATPIVKRHFYGLKRHLYGAIHSIDDKNTSRR